MEDCSHSIESKALTKWIEQNNFEIHLKLCPLCQTPILNTQRFMNQIKIIMADLSKIKEKKYGKPADRSPTSILPRYRIPDTSNVHLGFSKFPLGGGGRRYTEYWGNFRRGLKKKLLVKERFP